MIALALGCDVFWSGLIGYGPSLIEKELIKIKKKLPKYNEENELAVALKKGFESFLCSALENQAMKNLNIKENERDSCHKNLVNALVDSYLFEPGVIAEEVVEETAESHSNIYDKNGNNNDRNDDESVISSDNDSFAANDDDDSSCDSSPAGEKETDETTNQNNLFRHQYITTAPPQSLSKYVKRFATSDDITIRNDLSLCFCKGTSATRTSFLSNF